MRRGGLAAGGAAPLELHEWSRHLLKPQRQPLCFDVVGEETAAVVVCSRRKLISGFVVVLVMQLRLKDAEILPRQIRLAACTHRSSTVCGRLGHGGLKITHACPDDDYMGRRQGSLTLSLRTSASVAEADYDLAR